MRIGNAIFYGVAFIATGVLYWRHGIGAHQVVSLNISPRLKGETFCWKGKTYAVPEEDGDLNSMLHLVVSRMSVEKPKLASMPLSPLDAPSHE